MRFYANTASYHRCTRRLISSTVKRDQSRLGHYFGLIFRRDFSTAPPRRGVLPGRTRPTRGRTTGDTRGRNNRRENNRRFAYCENSPSCKKLRNNETLFINDVGIRPSL
ncbi:hypothetical protein PUN28_015011 [Cardiocondyla obscurior]|uniref:Uncharacterized protein n=1 Tax=Cardiocondyla obscurior TaxID=286306 RepID=A0AAW2EZM1_9HYME